MTDISFFESLQNGKSCYYVFNGTSTSSNNPMVVHGLNEVNVFNKRNGSWSFKKKMALGMCIITLCSVGLGSLATNLLRSAPQETQADVLQLVQQNSDLADSALEQDVPQLMGYGESATDMAKNAVDTTKDFGKKVATSAKDTGSAAMDKVSGLWGDMRNKFGGTSNIDED